MPLTTAVLILTVSHCYSIFMCVCVSLKLKDKIRCSSSFVFSSSKTNRVVFLEHNSTLFIRKVYTLYVCIVVVCRIFYMVLLNYVYISIHGVTRQQQQQWCVSVCLCPSKFNKLELTQDDNGE